MEILEFINNPINFEIEKKGKVKIFLIAFLCCTFIAGITTFVLLGINSALLDGSFGKRLQMTELYNYQIDSYFIAIFIVVIGPITEEFICRLPMKATRRNTSIAIFVFILLVLLPPWSSVIQMIGRTIFSIISALLVGVTFYYLLSKRLSAFLLRSSGKYLVFSLTVFFALMHLMNYSYSNIELRYLWLAPLFVLPQFIVGYFLAFVRLKISFVAGIVFHMLVNLPAGLSVLF